MTQSIDTVDTTWAFIGAAVAHRINGGEYVKPDTYIQTPEGFKPNPKQPNRLISALVIKGEIEALQEDIEFAEEVRTYVRGFTLKLLVDGLNDFEKKALSFTNSDRVKRMDVPLISSLPSCYIRAKEKMEVKDRIQDAKPEYLGSIDEKLTLNVTVIRSRLSKQYNCYFTTVVTESNHLVFFSQSSNPLQPGQTATITGKVKAHRDEWQTQLTRVKVI